MQKILNYSVDKVSILVPVYNREKIIAETIKSALNQTYTNIEVVVVDNCSTDNTWAIIEGFVKQDNRIKAFRNESNIGPVRNWLRCVEEASGKYGKILWSDDLIAPDFIEATLTLFNEEVGFVYTAAKIFEGDNYENGNVFYDLGNTGHYKSDFYIQKAIYNKGVPVSPGCAIFRLQDIRENLLLQIPNTINCDFSMHAIGNDLLLFLLTANQYKYFGHVAKPLSFFRAHEGSITISSSSGKLPLYYALAKAYFVENYRPEDRCCYASYVQLLLWRLKDARSFHINSIGDFFSGKVKISYLCLANFLFEKLLHLQKKNIRRLYTIINFRN